MDEEEYNFYDEDINKSNIVKVFLVLFIFVVISVGYFGYKKYQENKQEKPEENQISVNDKEIQNLYQQYNIFTTSIDDFSLYLQNDLFGYYYRADIYTNQTIANDVKLVTALNALFLDGTLTYEEESTEPLNIEGSVVREKVKKLFGKDVLYKDESIDQENATFCQFGNIIYDKDTDIYQTKGESSCVGSNRPIIKNKLIHAEKTDKEIIITDTMAYLVPDRDEENQVIYNVYDSMEETDDSFLNTINTQSEFAFYNYKHLHQYTYYFEKDGDTYYLSKVERIK